MIYLSLVHDLLPSNEQQKTNRDHGKKKHHPLIESEAMTSHLPFVRT